MIPIILAFMVGGLLGAGIRAVMAMGSQQSRFEEKNPRFNLEIPSRPAQAELEAFWENR